MRNAVRSVLEQTFDDFELVVCDNSDGNNQAATAAVLREFSDPRLRVITTGGRLSMPDNWERAIVDARGRFVGVLTDRSVYHSRALATVHAHVEASNTDLVGWFPDHYGADPRGREFRQRACTARTYELVTADILRYFLNGQPKYAGKMIPKLMTAMCRRDVLETIRSRVGRVCLPVAPDFTSGLLMLTHTPSMLLIDDTLFVSCGRGNGWAFRHRGALADQFLKDLGMTRDDVAGLVPTRACLTHALVLNDFLRAKQALPDAFAGFELNRAQYYLGCFVDYVRAARRGVDLSADLDMLIGGLALEDAATQAFVRCRQVYLEAIAALPAAGIDESQQVGAAVDPLDDESEGVAPQFDTVFDALRWAEANPRKPQAQSPVTMPPLDALRRWDERRAIARTAAKETIG